MDWEGKLPVTWTFEEPEVTPKGEVEPVPPCPILRGVVNPVKLVMSLFAPLLAAERFVLAVAGAGTSLRFADFCKEAASAAVMAFVWAVFAAFVANVSEVEIAFDCAVFAAFVAKVSAEERTTTSAAVAKVSAFDWALLAAVVAKPSAFAWAVAAAPAASKAVVLAKAAVPNPEI